MKHMIKQVPIPIAGVILGLTALGNLIQDYSSTLRLICGFIAAILALFLLLKFIIYPAQIKEEYKNPIIASVSATMFMSTMQLCTYAYPYVGIIAFYIWLCAIVSHLILIVWYTKVFLLRKSLEEIFPTIFITYVGIIVGSVTSATFHQERLGEVLFWLGFIFYIFVFILVTYRYLKIEVPEAAKPLFCIYTAPMSLSLTGYITVSQNISVPFIIVLEILAQLLFVMVLTQLPKLLKLPFYPSFAAFTFPFVITAFGLKKCLNHLISLQVSLSPIFHIILTIETLIAACMVLFALVHYLKYLFLHVKQGYQLNIEE